MSKVIRISELIPKNKFHIGDDSEYLEYSDSDSESDSDSDSDSEKPPKICYMQTPYSILNKPRPRTPRVYVYENMSIEMQTIPIDIKPQCKLYSVLKGIDNTCKQFILKNGGTYKPIICDKFGEVPTSCLYYFFGVKIPKPEYAGSQLITAIESQDYCTWSQAEMELINKKYYDYAPQYKLYNRTGKSVTEIKLKTFDDLISHMKHAKNIRFIVNFKLCCNKYKHYSLKIVVRYIEINYNQIVKYDYDYDYISKRMYPELKAAICKNQI